MKWALILALIVAGSAPAQNFKVSATVVGPDQTNAHEQQVSAQHLIRQAHLLRAELIAANALQDQARAAGGACLARAQASSGALAEASAIYFRLNETLPQDADVGVMSRRALELVRLANTSLQGCGTGDLGMRLAELEKPAGFTYMQNLILRIEAD